MKIRRLHWRTAGAALTAGIAGALLGMLNGILFMGEQGQSPHQENILRYQNFALIAGAVIGALICAAAAFLFINLARRKYQYPLSTGLGSRLGIASGILLNLATGLVVYAAAPIFGYTRSSPVGFFVEIIVTTFLAALCGLVAGYVMAEIGARDLSYWE